MSIEPIEIEPVQRKPVLRLSRFRAARWLPGDAAVGTVLALLMAGTTYFVSARMFSRAPIVVLLVLGAVLEFGVLLPLPILLLRKRSDPMYPGPRPPRRAVKEFLIAIPATIGILVCVVVVGNVAHLILTHLGHPTGSPLDFWGQLSKRHLIPLIVMAVAVAPVAEEIYFRGFLYNSLRSICPAWTAVFFQAFLFGLGHIYQPLGVFVTFVIGLLLALIYEWRKTLLATIFVHGMYNMVGMVAIVAVVMASAKAPMIGVTFQPGATEQAVVDKVLPDSPAEQADIRLGDVIVRYDGMDVTDAKQLIRLVRSGNAGDEATVDIFRNRKWIQKRIILRSRREVESQ